MTNQTKTRIAQFALGLLVALCGYLLAGCDGGAGTSDDLPDGGQVTLPRTDAGTAYCQIPSDLASIKMVNSAGQSTTTTMGSYYDQAANAGSTGKWAVVTNASEMPSADYSKSCSYATCTTSQDAATKAWTQLCTIDVAQGLGTWTSSLQVDTALCSPSGQFLGWLCVCKLNSQGVTVCP
jgi:hypothetical protein